MPKKLPKSDRPALPKRVRVPEPIRRPAPKPAKKESGADLIRRGLEDRTFI